MKKISLFTVILSIILVLSSITVFAATPNFIKVSITVGVGEKRALENYTQNSNTQITWTSQNVAIAAVSGNEIVGKKVGTAIINGKSTDCTYEIIVKVAESPVAMVTSNEKEKTSITKSDGSTISYKDISISIGVNDKVNISGLLPESYVNYLWSTSMPKSFSAKTFSYTQGVISSTKEGIVKLRVAGNSKKTKNSIIRINVTIDKNYSAKALKLNKQKNYNLNQFIGDAENFTYTVVTGKGGNVSIKDGILTTGNTSGTCLVTCESLTGGKNYTLVCKTL